MACRLARLTHVIRDSIVAAFQTGNASELLTGWRAVFAQTLLPDLAEEGREAEFADMFIVGEESPTEPIDVVLYDTFGRDVWIDVPLVDLREGQ